jgi:hypothetical protein
MTPTTHREDAMPEPRLCLWTFAGDRIAVRFQYEGHDRGGQWWRSYGNELREFDEHGLMRRREASINDVPIEPSDRRIIGPRGDGERGAEIALRWAPRRDQPWTCQVKFTGQVVNLRPLRLSVTLPVNEPLHLVADC